MDLGNVNLGIVKFGCPDPNCDCPCHTNYDQYLAEQMKNPEFKKEFDKLDSWQEEFYRVFENIGGDHFTSKEDRLINFISSLLDKTKSDTHAQVKEKIEKELDNLHSEARAGFNWTQDGVSMMNRIEELREKFLANLEE